MTLTRNGSTQDPDKIIQRAIDDSAQIPYNVTRDGVISAGGFGISTSRSAFLPAWGTRAREYALRDLIDRDEMNLFQGAFAGIAKLIAALPWEIKGDEEENDTFGRMAASQGWRLRRNNGVEYFQEVFRQANFGGGWGELVTQIIHDFLVYDGGGYIEAIAPGDAYDKPYGAITGIAHLDPLYTYPTGDPRYPAVYYDRYGGMHVMHHARVIRVVDMLRGDQLRPGYGKSALSRGVGIALAEIEMQRYIVGRLDDKAPPGVSIVGGILQAQWDAQTQKYRAMQSMDATPTFGQRMFYFVPDAALMPKLENYEFSAAPEKFDYRVYTDINVDRLANVLGVDRQELMQLSGGGAIGSAGQSMVLAQKARGKTIGFLLQQLERKLNDLLPDEFTFEFKYRDGQEALESAQKMQIIGAAVAAMTGILSPAEQKQILSNEIESVRDAIQDAPRANDVFNGTVTAEDDTAGAVPNAPVAQAQQPATQPPNVNINDDVEDDITAKTIQKDYSTTQALFIQDVSDLLKSASTPNTYLDRRAFGVVMRSFLKNYGTQAYKDGMAAGGTFVETLDAEEAADNARIFITQSQFIDGLADDIYKAKSVTPNNAQSRAMLWGKSLQQFNDAGMLAANKNAMYRWQVGISEHCPDCLRLNGQVHRAHNWKRSGWLPRASRLKCRGYNCRCSLIRTTETARGRF